MRITRATPENGSYVRVHDFAKRSCFFRRSSTAALVGACGIKEEFRYFQRCDLQLQNPRTLQKTVFPTMQSTFNKYTIFLFTLFLLLLAI
jgi:hypothetical protein